MRRSLGCWLSARVGLGMLVLDSILNPLPSEVIRPGAQSQPVSAIPTEGSPIAGPHTALDMLLSVLQNPDTMPAEVRSNVCSLLGQLGRKGVVEEESSVQDVMRMKAKSRELLEGLATDSEGTTQMVSAAARRALETWA